MTETSQTSSGDIEFDEENHKYFHKGIEVPGVTSILQAEGFVDYSKIPKHRRSYYMERGTSFHKTLELSDRNMLDESALSEKVGIRLEAWKKFKKDKGFEIHTIEKIRFNKKLWYAGTEDRSGVFTKGDSALRGKPVSLDLKGVEAQNWVRLQGCGYVLTRKNWKDWIRYAVTFSHDGRYEPFVFQEDHDYRIFENAVQNQAWKKAYGGKLWTQ